ncbi:disease resistance protein [Pyrus ussuriensis x Pyrus communis]|uniref:Disease resistance protein n=1 Tax=Pyrus ussuriensis x Pyrus communis TaxID=2448454 RepID=A0A5N5FVB4_9ROSA|nr:disease resistance protein [Pyrus ussuriensis x Pyrus communis]
MALAVVGGAALSGFFQQVFVKLDSQEVRNFIRGKKLTDGLLKKLRIKLMSVSAVYDDAEQKQLRNPHVRLWLHELKEAVLDAEDLLDEIKTEALRRKIEAEFGSSTSKVQDLISASLHAFDEPVDSKIEEILERLSFIVEQKDALDLKRGSRHKISRTLLSTSLRETIIQLLLSNDVTCSKIGIIPIVGMGGIGKTTLAQLLYNDDRVKQHFELQAWVYHTNNLSSVTSQTCDTTDLNQLQVKLKDVLAGKKFLFVLDDVWNENYNIWDSLRRPFESGAHGSKIIVTARNDGHLLEEDCWFLFAKHASKDASGVVDPNLEVIGRQIVSKCKGLPLAAKSLGGLLRSEPNVEEWENVLKSDIWELSDAKIEILPALWLSYQYLSPVLKHCFAYCSIFPKDYRFHKSELILLWMAEDLLQPQKKTRLEDVGEKYFDDLISRSFFQYSSSNDCFIMHDLIHDWRLTYIFDIIYEAKYLRTFILGKRYCWQTIRLDLLLMLQCLRVLNLPGHYIAELPDSISNLKHLRLYNLQTLLVSKCRYLAELPTNLRRLINLRHLDFRGTQIKKTPPHMGKLKDLQTFGGEFVLSKDAGGNIDELKGFQHLSGNLHISGLQNIKRAEDALEAKLKDKKLSEIRLKWEGDTIDSQNDSRVLGNLQPNTKLKVLAIEGYEGTKFPGWLGDESFSNLVTIRLVDCEYCFSLPALGQLPSLKRLEIYGLNGVESVGSEFYGGIKPAFRSLEFLSFCRMQEWQEWCFPGVGNIRLPNLVCFVGGGVLLAPNLKEITIPFKNLWSVPKICNLAPISSSLSIEGCKEFKSFPEESKFSSLDVIARGDAHLSPFSSSLSIGGCKEFKSFPEESKFSSLDDLKIMKFVGFLHGGLQAPNLKEMEIKECNRSLPEEMQISLPSLESLCIRDCPELESFPEGGLPSKLRSLRIWSCKKLMANRMWWGLQTQTSLKHLEVSFLECEEEEIVESFPEEGLLPTTLTSLRSSRIRTPHLSRGVGDFSLSSTPELAREGLPSSLSYLRIYRV